MFLQNISRTSNWNRTFSAPKCSSHRDESNEL